MNPLASRFPFWTRVLPLLLVAVPARLAAQGARPQGEWRLDEARSDSLHLPSRGRLDSLSPRPPEGSGPGGTPPGAGPATPGGAPGIDGGRRYPGGGRYRRATSEKDLARFRQTVALARRAPVRIRFEENGSSIVLTDAQGFETTLRIDGRKTRETVLDGGDVDTKARWDDETLVIERRVDGGGRVTERYTLGLGGIRLLSFIAVDGLLQPLEFTRQFRRGG